MPLERTFPTTIPMPLTPCPRAFTNWGMGTPSTGKNAEATMWDVMAVTKALADENRVRMLLAVHRKELCLCQLIELVGLAPSTVSKHMSILRQARLVEGRKEGRWMYYQIAGPNASKAVRDAIAWVRRSLARDPRIAEDIERLDRILKMDLQELCESQLSTDRRCRGPAGKATA
jgi:ArsR family transcriptional regulator, arsenate/arsenite/antimonite-responsive transcriptional repressor